MAHTVTLPGQIVFPLDRSDRTAKCSATNDDEHAVSTVTAGPPTPAHATRPEATILVEPVTLQPSSSPDSWPIAGMDNTGEHTPLPNFRNLSGHPVIPNASRHLPIAGAVAVHRQLARDRFQRISASKSPACSRNACGGIHLPHASGSDQTPVHIPTCDPPENPIPHHGPGPTAPYNVPVHPTWITASHSTTATGFGQLASS